VVRVYRESTARQIVENLYYAVRAFSQNRPQFDDITATVIKVALRR
jgi:serine phosphatase RsbU (regulator of sigma subunit)